jgi:hypothetical protein
MDTLVIPPSVHEAHPPKESLRRWRRDPSRMGYPPALPVEIALQEHDPEFICSEYGIDAAEWDRIRVLPRFVADVSARLIELESEGASFRMKARLQAEAFLEDNFDMVKDEKTPLDVKVRIIQNTIKVAGLDASKEQSGAAAGSAIGAALQINLHLG